MDDGWWRADRLIPFAGEIDEFDIQVIPTFIGEGIPLIAPRHRDISLHLRSARKFPDGVVRLRYDVAK